MVVAANSAARATRNHDARSAPVQIIAHAAGNSEAAFLAALPGGPDFIEVDLWAHGGRLEARHERALYPLPFLFEKWYLHWAPRSPFSLAQLLRIASGQVSVLLDLKNGDDHAAQSVERAMAASPDVTVAASSQSWEVLRAVARRCPTVDMYYSIDVPAKLDLFLSVCERDSLPRGVSCYHELLDATVVKFLTRRGLQVFAWTVDDVERGKELAMMGVAGITTHRVHEMRAATSTGA